VRACGPTRVLVAHRADLQAQHLPLPLYIFCSLADKWGPPVSSFPFLQPALLFSTASIAPPPTVTPAFPPPPAFNPGHQGALKHRPSPLINFSFRFLFNRDRSALVAVATRQHRSTLHRRVSPHSHVSVYCAGVRTAHTRALHPRPVRGSLRPLALSRACPPPYPESRSPTRARVTCPPTPLDLTPLQHQPAVNRCNQFTYIQSSCRNGCGHHGHQWPLPISVPAVSISPALPPACL
jgi:hypothetical protein